VKRPTRSPWLQTNTVAGIALLAIFLLALVVAFTVQKGVPFRDYNYVTVAFADAGSLRVGDDVRLRSVREGQVSSIEVGDNEALVRLQLPDDLVINRDARARIRARSALGQAYVDLNPGTPEAGDIGDDVLPTSSSRSQVQLDSLLDVFDKRTREQAAVAARSAGTGAARHGEDLSTFLSTAPDSLDDLGAISQALSSDEAGLDDTLRAAATLSGHIEANSTELAALIESSNAVLDSFAVDESEPLKATLRQAPGTLGDARSALMALREPLDDTTSAVTMLRPALADLGRQTPDLRKTLTSGTAALRNVPRTARAAEPAVRSLTGTSQDLRPLAPQISSALVRAQRPLTAVGYYGTNAGLFFEWFASALSQSLPNGGHFLRLDLVTGTSAVGGSIPGPTPLTNRNPYPGPAEAYNEGGN
jgi:phospholipid/cholesterol/gamma-HCH transport system substrate-binding protein